LEPDEDESAGKLEETQERLLQSLMI
jgi:hypothetical protein